MYHAIVAAHGSIGLIALLSYWTAALSKKGSPLHRRAGRWFLLAICGICLTGLPIAAGFFQRGNLIGGAFFSYLLVILFNAAWCGWRAVQLKRDFAAYIGGGFRPLAWLSIASGALVLALGISAGSVVLTGFSLVGLLRGAGMLRLAARPPQPRWAIFEHLGSMIGCGVATHVAFLSIGLPRLLPASMAGSIGIAAWFGPLLVAAMAGLWWGRKLRPQPQGQQPLPTA